MTKIFSKIILCQNSNSSSVSRLAYIFYTDKVSSNAMAYSKISLESVKITC